MAGVTLELIFEEQGSDALPAEAHGNGEVQDFALGDGRGVAGKCLVGDQEAGDLVRNFGNGAMAVEEIVGCPTRVSKGLLFDGKDGGQIGGGGETEEGLQ